MILYGVAYDPECDINEVYDTFGEARDAILHELEFYLEFEGLVEDPDDAAEDIRRARNELELEWCVGGGDFARIVEVNYISH